MAETLAVLVKVAAYKVEQAQQVLGKAEQALARAEADVVRWREEAANGLAMAARAADALLFNQAGNFRDRARGEEAKAVERVAVCRIAVNEAREALAAEYGAQKRFEILAERQRVQALKRRQAKQQASMEDTFAQKR